MRRTASRQGARSFISIRGPRCWRRPQSSFPLVPQLRINGNIQTVSSPADPSATAKPRWRVVKRCSGGGGIIRFSFYSIFSCNFATARASQTKTSIQLRCVKVSDKKEGKLHKRQTCAALYRICEKPNATSRKMEMLISEAELPGFGGEILAPRFA